MSKKKDLKEALSSFRKPDLSHMRTPFLVYGTRGCQYGDYKYERSNYLREMETFSEDVERFRGYLTSTLRHVLAVLDSIEYHQANDPSLKDVEALKKAVYAIDLDVKPGDKYGPSKLPHVCGAIASLQMAVVQAVRAGVLPEDPGTPWLEEEEQEKADICSS